MFEDITEALHLIKEVKAVDTVLEVLIIYSCSKLWSTTPHFRQHCFTFLNALTKTVFKKGIKSGAGWLGGLLMGNRPFHM